jgi:intracellular sulfur oxidation DsrE/DsrF family protein/SAM-dependent methyltransferase
VIAVDISRRFLDHIEKSSRESGLRNVDTVLCTAESTELPAESVDLAFICDTYHHFEFPLKTMASLHRALKPGGRVVLIDFRRIEGQSSDFVLGHVRAGQAVFEAEVERSGFRKVREEPDLLKENYFLVFEKRAGDRPPADAGRRAGGMGRRPGRGRGPGPTMRADRDVFHYLLRNHAEIRRTVKPLQNGVETLTESDNPPISAKIQEHVAAMHERLETGRGLRYWDDLFVALFQNHSHIQMTVENTAKGVRVKETSDNPLGVALIRAHAEVVSRFVAHGFEEAHKNHAVPSAEKSAPEPAALLFPIIRGQGGVVARQAAVGQPRVGAKVVLDVTADGKPSEVNQGLERTARLLNLYGAAEMKASDVAIAVVLHGEATKCILTNESYRQRFAEPNPNLPLIQSLREAGVEITVCGQALSNKSFADSEVVRGIPISAAALTFLINKQSEGFAYVPVP